LLAQNIALIEHLNRLKDNFGKDFVYNFDVWINQNTNKLKEIKMLNNNVNYTDQETSNSEENSKKFDSFESEESSEFDSGIYYFYFDCVSLNLISFFSQKSIMKIQKAIRIALLKNAYCIDK
jgi:hypothetical protein